MTREQYYEKIVDCKANNVTAYEVIKAQTIVKNAYIKSLESKLTIARD